MRRLRPTNQKIKVTLSLCSILSISSCEPIVQSKGQNNVAGASIYGFAGGISNPGKEREYRIRNIISGSAQGRLGSLNAGEKIHGETQLQRSEVYQKEKKSVLIADSRTVVSLKGPKAEVKFVQCKEQENHYFEWVFEQNLAKQPQWDAK